MKIIIIKEVKDDNFPPNIRDIENLIYKNEYLISFSFLVKYK